MSADPSMLSDLPTVAGLVGAAFSTTAPLIQTGYLHKQQIHQDKEHHKESLTQQDKIAKAQMEQDTKHHLEGLAMEKFHHDAQSCLAKEQHKQAQELARQIHEKELRKNSELHGESLSHDRILHQEALTQSKDLHDDAAGLAKEIHREALLQELKVHVQGLQHTEQLAGFSLAHDRRLHNQTLEQDRMLHREARLIDREFARREEMRDMLQQRTLKANTLMIVDTLMFGCCFALFIEGMQLIPVEGVPSAWMLAFAWFFCAAICSLFLSVWFAMALQSRMTKYVIAQREMIYRPCGKRHGSFDEFYRCHCKSLSAAARETFYSGAIFVMVTLAVLVHIRFSILGDNLAATLTVVSGIGIAVVVLIVLRTAFPAPSPRNDERALSFPSADTRSQRRMATGGDGNGAETGPEGDGRGPSQQRSTEMDDLEQPVTSPSSDKPLQQQGGGRDSSYFDHQTRLHQESRVNASTSFDAYGTEHGGDREIVPSTAAPPSAERDRESHQPLATARSISMGALPNTATVSSPLPPRPPISASFLGYARDPLQQPHPPHPPTHSHSCTGSGVLTSPTAPLEVSHQSPTHLLSGSLLHTGGILGVQEPIQAQQQQPALVAGGPQGPGQSSSNVLPHSLQMDMGSSTDLHLQGLQGSEARIDSRALARHVQALEARDFALRQQNNAASQQARVHTTQPGHGSLHVRPDQAVPRPISSVARRAHESRDTSRSRRAHGDDTGRPGHKGGGMGLAERLSRTLRFSPDAVRRDREREREREERETGGEGDAKARSSELRRQYAVRSRSSSAVAGAFIEDFLALLGEKDAWLPAFVERGIITEDDLTEISESMLEHIVTDPRARQKISRALKKVLAAKAKRDREREDIELGGSIGASPPTPTPSGPSVTLSPVQEDLTALPGLAVPLPLSRRTSDNGRDRETADQTPAFVTPHSKPIWADQGEGGRSRADRRPPPVDVSTGAGRPHPDPSPQASNAYSFRPTGSRRSLARGVTQDALTASYYTAGGSVPETIHQQGQEQSDNLPAPSAPNSPEGSRPKRQHLAPEVLQALPTKVTVSRAKRDRDTDRDGHANSGDQRASIISSSSNGNGATDPRSRAHSSRLAPSETTHGAAHGTPPRHPHPKAKLAGETTSQAARQTQTQSHLTVPQQSALGASSGSSTFSSPEFGTAQFGGDLETALKTLSAQQQQQQSSSDGRSPTPTADRMMATMRHAEKRLSCLMTQIRADMIRNSTLGHTPATPPQRHRTSSEHSTPQTAQTASGGVRRPVERQQGGGTASRRNRRAISTDGDETVQVSSREGSNRHQMQQQQPGGSQRGFLGLTFPRRGGNRTTAGRTPPPTPPRHLQFRGLETVPSNDLSGYSSSSGFSRISEGNGGSGDSLPLSLTQRGGGDVSKGRERGGQGKREKGENSSRIDAGPVTPTARSQVGTLSDDRDTGSPTVPLKYGTSQGAMAAAEGNQGAILALAAAGHGGYLTATLGEAQDELTSRSRRPSLLNESSLGSNASLSVPMQYGRGAPPTFTPSRLAAEVVREGGDNAEGEGGGREKAAMVSTPSDGGEGSGGLIRDPRLAPSGVTEQEEGDGMRGGGGFDSVYASSHHNRSQIVGDEQRQRPRETSKTSQGGEKEQRERGIGGIFLGVEAQRQAGGRVGGGQSSEQFERPGRSSPAESHPESAARTVWRHPLHPQSPPAVEVPFSFTDETERKKEQQGEEERESGWRNSDCLPSPSLLDTEREREVHADPQHNAAPPSTSSSSVFSSSPRHRPPPADAKSAKDAEWKQRKPPDPGSPNEQEAAFPSGPFASCDEEERQSEGMNSSSSSSSERLSSGAFQSAWGGESSLSLSSLHDPKESSREGEGDQDTRNSETLGARVSFLPLSISLRSQHTTATGEEDNAERAGAAEGHHFNFEGDMRGKESVSPCVAFRKVRLSAEDGGDDFEIERSPRSLFRFPPPFSIEKGQQNGREWTEENGMTGDEWGYKGVYRKGIFRERENLFGGLGGAPTMQQIHIGPFVSREEKRTSRLSEGCEMSRRGRHVNIGDGSVVNPTDIFLSLSVSDLNDMV